MAKDDARTVARISLPLTEDGSAVDWEHVRTATAEKFEGLLRTDPKIRQAYEEENGLGKDAGFDEGITPEDIATALDALQGFNALVFRVAAAKFIKNPVLRDREGKPLPLTFDPELMDRTFALTPAQHAKLDPKGTRLAKKYSDRMPRWMREHYDLYMFGAIFLACIAQNAKLTIETQVKRDLGRAQDAFARARAVQPKNPQPDSDVQAQPVNGHDRTEPAPFTPSGIAVEEEKRPAPPEAPTV